MRAAAPASSGRGGYSTISRSRASGHVSASPTTHGGYSTISRSRASGHIGASPTTLSLRRIADNPITSAHRRPPPADHTDAVTSAHRRPPGRFVVTTPGQSGDGQTPAGKRGTSSSAQASLHFAGDPGDFVRHTHRHHPGTATTRRRPGTTATRRRTGTSATRQQPGTSAMRRHPGTSAIRRHPSIGWSSRRTGDPVSYSREN